MKSKKRTSFMLLFLVLAIYLGLLAMMLLVGRNISYSASGKPLTILKQSELDTGEGEKEQARTLIVYQDDADGKKGGREIKNMLKQMRIEYDRIPSEKFDPAVLERYDKLVLAVSFADALSGKEEAITAWVEEGNSLMFAFPPEYDKAFSEFEELLGIRRCRENKVVVKAFQCVDEFMPGGSRELSVSSPFESSLDVTLEEDCHVYLQSVQAEPIPLIWSRTVGKGTIVFDNLNFMEKAYRGFHCAAYSLMGKAVIWPVINGSTFYIDDFPSPVPQGDSYQIKQDYGMDIKDFYTQVWWRDICNLSRKYDIPYTGLIIEEYSNQTSGTFLRQTDTTRFIYFGNMLLRQGGELGIHGYNHMPLVLENFDYYGRYNSYRQWQSQEDMRHAISELLDFSHELFPEETFSVYVPPSNIISPEGRDMLTKDFSEVKCIASLYLSDKKDLAYATDFTVTEDGMILTPRIISGYVLEDYMRTAAMSELYLHCVNTHFQHPDDVLDVDRGANLGWEELYQRFEDYVNWLHTALPDLRPLTGSELAGAVQRYDAVDLKRTETESGIHVKLNDFSDEAWFYLRVNQGEIQDIGGGKSTKAADGLYLIQALEPEMDITIEE